ncbi:hypothetical protein AB0M75_30945, partial [Streptomyces anulatus]
QVDRVRPQQHRPAPGVPRPLDDPATGAYCRSMASNYNHALRPPGHPDRRPDRCQPHQANPTSTPPRSTPDRRAPTTLHTHPTRPDRHTPTTRTARPPAHTARAARPHHTARTACPPAPPARPELRPVAR